MPMTTPIWCERRAKSAAKTEESTLPEVRWNWPRAKSIEARMKAAKNRADREGILVVGEGLHAIGAHFRVQGCHYG